MGLILSKGTCVGCEFNLQLRCIQEATDGYFFLSLSRPPSLKLNKTQLIKIRKLLVYSWRPNSEKSIFNSMEKNMQKIETICK